MQMRPISCRALGSLCLLGLGLVGCGSETPTFTDQVREISEANGAAQPALWEVADDDTQVFLFGTAHTLRPDTPWLTARVKTRIEASDAVYFEADTQSARARDGVEIAVTQLGLFEPGERLRDLLDEKERAQLAEAADLVGVPIAGLDTFRPWFVSATLEQMYAQVQGFDDELGVEEALTDLAQTAGKPLRYLETGADQMALLASIPEADQVDMLVETTVQMLERPTLLDEMVAEWQVGDVGDLEEMMAEDRVFDGAAYEIMLKGRNVDWTEQIDALLDTEAGVFFVAVGAAHLLGEDSVQAMLRARGFKVGRVDASSDILGHAD